MIKWIIIPFACVAAGYYVIGPWLVKVAPNRSKIAKQKADHLKSKIEKVIQAKPATETPDESGDQKADETASKKLPAPDIEVVAEKVKPNNAVQESEPDKPADSNPKPAEPKPSSAIPGDKLEGVDANDSTANVSGFAPPEVEVSVRPVDRPRKASPAKRRPKKKKKPVVNTDDAPVAPVVTSNPEPPSTDGN